MACGECGADMEVEAGGGGWRRLTQCSNVKQWFKLPLTNLSTERIEGQAWYQQKSVSIEPRIHVSRIL